VKTVQDLEEYPWPDIMEDYRHGHLEETVKRLHDRDLFVIGSTGHMGWEKACYMRGILNICEDLADNQAFATYLLDKLCDFFCFMSCRFAEAGADMLWLSEDIGMQDRLMISPAMYRRWIKPRTKRVIDAARCVNPAIWVAQHHCGYVEPLISDFVEIGVNALHPIQPESMNPRRIKQKFGDVLTLWGTVGAQSVMPFGTPDEVAETVRGNIRDLGFNGGLWIAPSQALEPDVPWENVAAFFDTVEEFGSEPK
jgi:uroporphyrinogen decarboxylase